MIVIAVIFIGIIVVLLYLRVAKNGEKTNRKYISREETIKDKTGEDIEDLENIVEYAEETAEKPVINFETIEEKIKNSEAEMIAKFAAVIKDVRVKIDAKLTTEIEELIAKIEEREKEIVNKIENIIEAKVQEVLNKMNDRVGAALHAQKKPTASVLEELVDPLRTEEVPADSLISEKAEKTVKEKVDFEEMKEGPVSVSSSNESKAVVEEAVGGTDDFDMQEFLKEEPVGISFSGESNVLSEDNVEKNLEAKESIVSSGKIEEKVPEEAGGDSADFDIQAFLDELENLPSEKDPKAEK
ncbi:MAG: hypothetical protein K8F52_16425 [Candidatus Scalindua rubra]|nr:hypothetical protein [Candidatus Scalindua rubra]